jgi:PadR family transcriptional regulator, regulatory protein AphA
MAIEYVLLGLLAEEPRHGYDLAREFVPGTVLGDIVHLEPSLLYANLKKLERDGLVSSTVEPQGPRPPRRMLRITPEGHAELIRWLAEPVERTRDLRLEFLAKLYLARRIDPALASQLIEGQREVCQGFVTSLREQLHSDGEADDFHRLVLEMRLAQNQALLDWLNRASERIAAEGQSRQESPARA